MKSEIKSEEIEKLLAKKQQKCSFRKKKQEKVQVVSATMKIKIQRRIYRSEMNEYNK